MGLYCKVCRAQLHDARQEVCSTKCKRVLAAQRKRRYSTKQRKETRSRKRIFSTGKFAGLQLTCVRCGAKLNHPGRLCGKCKKKGLKKSRRRKSDGVHR